MCFINYFTDTAVANICWKFLRIYLLTAAEFCYILMNFNCYLMFTSSNIIILFCVFYALCVGHTFMLLFVLFMKTAVSDKY